MEQGQEYPQRKKIRGEAVPLLISIPEGEDVSYLIVLVRRVTLGQFLQD